MHKNNFNQKPRIIVIQKLYSFILNKESTDIDLIICELTYYNDDIIETAELCVPHKHMHERMFVLIPLHDIAPELLHPKYNKTVDELLQICIPCHLYIF